MVVVVAPVVDRRTPWQIEANPADISQQKSVTSSTQKSGETMGAGEGGDVGGRCTRKVCTERSCERKGWMNLLARIMIFFFLGGMSCVQLERVVWTGPGVLDAFGATEVCPGAGACDTGSVEVLRRCSGSMLKGAVRDEQPPDTQGPKELRRGCVVRLCNCCKSLRDSEEWPSTLSRFGCEITGDGRSGGETGNGDRCKLAFWGSGNRTIRSHDVGGER